jgi:glucose uptake protein GlcU
VVYPLPALPGKLIFPSILSGLIWAVGMVAWFQANVELGYTVAFPIVGSLPGIIAIFIGLCFLGEMQTRRSRMSALIGMLLRVPGVLLIALSTY